MFVVAHISHQMHPFDSNRVPFSPVHSVPSLSACSTAILELKSPSLCRAVQLRSAIAESSHPMHPSKRSSSAAAFVQNPLHLACQNGRASRRQPAICMSSARDSQRHMSRRSLLRGAAAAAVPPLLSAYLPDHAGASVDIDLERFGDKELKVSAINKVKQNCRNVLSQKPELLPYFFELTLHDALTFNPETNEGGPNGSLRLELDRETNKELAEANEAIASIRALQRQDMSYADTCAFAGAVAVEVTGGPRIVVQLGREDAKQPDPEWKTNFYKPGASAEDLKAAFDAAGLNGARDVVLFHGAIGSLNNIGQSRAEKLRASAISDDEDEDEDYDDLDDVTYGKVQGGKRGPVLVSSNVSQLTFSGEKFSNAYLNAILKAKNPSELSQRDRAILGDKEMLAEAQRYASNNGKFTNDIADLYQKISLLGSSFESMKLEDK